MSTAPGYKKKLIEVALPLDEINKQSAREKSIRHGHPSTFHLWWARRPLAACRAVLFAQLVDDPSAHPEEFPTEEDQILERKRLFSLIERLVDWNNLNDEALYEEARKEIWKSCDGNPPPILDPFAGGGSIPLEAQRLGLEANASDLNPVPVLINKALIEIPPKWAEMSPVFPGIAESRLGSWPGSSGLAEDVHRYGEWIRKEAEKRIGNLYPTAKFKDGTEAKVISWIWARTITCPNPACGGSMPLARSFWLSKKQNKERYIEPIVEGKSVRFEIRGPEGTPREGTIVDRRATCIICESPVKTDYIQREGKAGRIGSQLMAVVAEGPRMRYYVTPTKEHEDAAKIDRPKDVPDAPLAMDPRNIWCVNYGLDTFDKLFTDRQLVALTTLSNLIATAHEKIVIDARSAGLTSGARLANGGMGAEAYADSVTIYLGLLISKVADRLSNVCGWDSSTKTEGTRNVFARQAIPMVWDYSEANPFIIASGGIAKAISAMSAAIRSLNPKVSGHAVQANATIRDYSGKVISTDPPYYDNITYADLSDFFYVWLRKSLQGFIPELLSTMLTPKADELIANTYRQGGKEQSTQFFEDGFQRTFAHMRKGALTSYPMTVFYAFKQSEREGEGEGEASTGWETLLEGMIRSGWSITATWPIRTELKNKILALGRNVLASSIVLACRPRPQDAASIDRRGLISALKAELPAALRDLQQGGIAPVDLAQAAIGPGMAVYSRYSRVVESDGSSMRVRAALALINQILAEILSEQEGDFDSDTRFCIKWFETHAFDIGKFGDAETLSKAMDTAVSGLDRAGVLKARAGIVQLLSPAELPKFYDPANDGRISVWEVVTHLAKQLSEEGIDAAASLMAAAKTRVDLDTAKELTYLLYSICEKKKWSEIGLLFNELGTAWPEIEKTAHATASMGNVQGTLDYSEED